MDLLTGRPVWRRRNISCVLSISPDEWADTVIIGAGTTGAFIAHDLTTQGHDVLMIDRATPASGSTWACTAIIQYELDTFLDELLSRIGESDTRLILDNCRQAVNSIRELSRTLHGSVACFQRPSVYLATDAKGVRDLQLEFAHRKRMGLEVQLLSENELKDHYPFTAPLAIRNDEALELNPVELTLCLLEKAISQGLRVSVPVNVRAIESSDSAVILTTENGGTIRCNKLIVAAGYETYHWLPKKLGKLSSTYAVATPPGQRVQKWDDRSVVWESGRPYHYLRRTEDDRIIIGGKDKPFRNTVLRDLFLPIESHRLRKKMREMLQDTSLQIETAWCGTFAESKDGLPLMGSLPNEPRIYYLFASGGNGVTFAALAPKLINFWFNNMKCPLQDLFSLTR
jgi:glycine/D-amino acid oxidase-like deaminating enzyme